MYHYGWKNWHWWNTNNKFDKNAIAIKDYNRTDPQLACIMDFDQTKLFSFKVKHQAIVKECRIGPQHEGTVDFFIKAELEALLNNLQLHSIWLSQD